MAGKGDGDTRSPDYKARRDGYDKIDWGDEEPDYSSYKKVVACYPHNPSHPLGACGSHCDDCMGGGCCGE